MFLTVTILKNDEGKNAIKIFQIGDVFFVEPVVFKDSFCDALDSFIHRYVKE